MPYIAQDKREWIDGYGSPEDAGELNYLLTTIVHQYIEERGANYQAYNDVLGVLEGCKLELYRRKVSVYEDRKIEENGDV